MIGVREEEEVELIFYDRFLLLLLLLSIQQR